MTGSNDYIRAIDTLTVFLVAGGGILIIVAILRYGLLTGKKVLDFHSDKLGIALAGDAFAVIMVVGCLSCYFGLLHYEKNFESKYQDLNAKYADAISKVKYAEEFKEDLADQARRYQMRALVNFPEHLTPEMVNFSVKVQSASGQLNEYVPGDGEGKYGRSNLEPIVLHFKCLRHSDVVLVQADCEGKRWDARFAVPETVLKMQPAQPTVAVK